MTFLDKKAIIVMFYLIIKFIDMMKFQNFEELYGAACDIFAAAGHNPVVAASVARQKKVLLAQFAANFPSSLNEAEEHPGFDVLQFMNMLLKFPEILGGKGLKLKLLLSSFEDNRIDVLPELKVLCENLQDKTSALTDEEKEIESALRKSFPTSLNELKQMPFPTENVIAFLSSHNGVCCGRRRAFISLMCDLSKSGFPLTEELIGQRKGTALHP